MVSGLIGLCSAVGLAESIKADELLQEDLLNAYRHAATTDGLTGIANRNSLDNMLSTLLCDPKCPRTRLCMIMVDIDHFKAFNDQWGHQAGDAVLYNVAGKLSEFFKADRLVARYGGEEFAIVLTERSLSEVTEMAERCRRFIREGVCQFRDRSFQVTISCGVTEALSTDSPETLTQRADLALYTAKRLGRNMVCVDGTDPRQPAFPVVASAERALSDRIDTFASASTRVLSDVMGKGRPLSRSLRTIFSPQASRRPE